MNTLDALLSWFAGATLRGSVLALAVLAIQAALRGWLPAPWRYALWLPVVFVCLSPRLPQSRWSVENRFATRTIHVQPSTLPSPFLTTVPDGLRSAEVSTKNWYTPPRTDWRRVAAVTWLAGVAGMLTCAFAAYARTMARMRRGARPPDAALVTMLADMALVAGLRRAPRFLVSTSVESPAVTGFLRPLFTADEARRVDAVRPWVTPRRRSERRAECEGAHVSAARNRHMDSEFTAVGDEKRSRESTTSWIRCCLRVNSQSVRAILFCRAFN